MKELELIRWIRSRSPCVPGVVVGIGDDAAVLDPAPGRRIVVTTDMSVEGTHFESGDAAGRVGRKALAVSISDVAAMGCRSFAAFVAVALRRDLPKDYARGLFLGIRDLAAEFGLSLAGGDTTGTRGPVVICTTVVGQPPAGADPVLRSGARVGQSVLVTGELGGSLSGRHLDFVPRQREALELIGRFRPGAMIDLSDGLSTDAGHVAEASGVRLRLRSDLVPVAAAATGGGLSSALNDGEDFELLFTLDSEAAAEVERTGLAGTRVTRIGEVREGPAGVSLADAAGHEVPLERGGYEHLD